MNTSVIFHPGMMLAYPMTAKGMAVYDLMLYVDLVGLISDSVFLDLCYFLKSWMGHCPK